MIMDKKLIFFLIILFIFLFVLPVHSVPFISNKKEIEIGQSGNKQIILQYGIYQDKSLQLYINELDT